MLHWLGAASCPQLARQSTCLACAAHRWLPLPRHLTWTAAGCHHPEPSSCCAALQVWLGLFPMQTVMLAVVCVSCVLLSPRVDVEARTLQVGNLGTACFCSLKP